MACEVRLIETWKALNIEDYCLSDIFERVQTTRDTRSANKVRLKTFFKTRIRETSFQLPSVELWNNAPLEITEAKTESQAKAAIRKWLYVVCSIFQVKFVLKMVVIVCSTLVIVCSTGRLNFVLQKNV